MHKLGKSFRQPVGKSFGQDGIVIVVAGSKFFREFIGAMNRNSETADVILLRRSLTTGCRRNEVGQTVVRLTGRFLHLLSKKIEGCQFFPTFVVGKKIDIIAPAVRRPETVNTAGNERFLANDLLQQLLRVVEELARLLSDCWIIKDRRVPATQFPGMKKRRPVDELHESFKRDQTFFRK